MKEVTWSFDGAGAKAAVALRGRGLLNQPLVNKGTGFSLDERRAFGLEGLLPHAVSDIESQVEQVWGTLCAKTEPLERYIGMTALQDRNETLFYRVLLEHVEELMPIVYTPTVGEACQQYSRIFRRGRGIWITAAHRGRVREVLANSPCDPVRLIVVTDNERILGLGDQGAGGMGIPIGKLALYTMAAGIHPSQTLPVSLDVGTDNEALLADPLYLGVRERRLRGAEYDSLVEEFVLAVKELFPRALLQWEDFKKGNAFALLDRYRDVLPSFNDDIEGTAAVALAGVMAACRAKGERLAEQRIVILGAGAAGVGIGRLLRDALHKAGLEGTALLEHMAILDSRGLLVEGGERGDAYKRSLAWPAELATNLGLKLEQSHDLAHVVDAIEPTVLIGTSGQPGVFNQDIVQRMARRVERPVIFPLSNPTSKSEATPEQLFGWTDGRALVATGSPFGPVSLAGRTLEAAQCNNVYVFPGVGLGCLVSEARRVRDRFFTLAAEVLADAVTTRELERGLLFPALNRLREVTLRIAEAVATEVQVEGLAGLELGDVAAEVERAMWFPRYPTLTAASSGGAG